MADHTTSRSQVSRLVTVFGTIAAAIAVMTASSASPALADDSPVVQRPSGHVTADALPTVQINGVVWDQTVIGNRVYAVGEFTQARPAGSAPGQNETPRSNILAFDIETGKLDTGFDASLNAQGKTVTASPDGSRLYIGGNFTNVNGVNRYRLAALDPVSGDLIPGFDAAVSYRVNSIIATSDTLYVGGKFGASRGATRSNLAAFSAADGSLLAWAPSADDEVNAMTLTPDGSKVIVGGRFGTLSGVQARGTGALDAVTGATLPWAMNAILSTYGDRGAFLELSSDDTAVYGNAYHYGGPSVKWEGVFSADPDTGDLNWNNDCHGDTYANTVMNGYVYAVSHAHYCSNVGGFPQSETWSDNLRHATSMTTEATGTLRADKWGYASFAGTPSPSMVNWAPRWQIGSYTSAEMAGWTVEGNGEYLVIGGEFLGVNNAAQQGLVRFAVGSTAPSKEGPRLGGPDFVPQVRSFASGDVRISFLANHDRDDSFLTHDIIRDGDTGNPIFSTTVESAYWKRPTTGYTDTGLSPGSTHTYQVRATDPDGNIAYGDPVSITVSGSGDPSPYADAVMADSPTLHWRFGEAAGSTGAADDWVGEGNGSVGPGITRGAPGAIVDDSDTAYELSGFGGARVHEAGDDKPVIDTYSIEAWVNTTSITGGRVLGFSGNATGDSTTNQVDRHIYLSNDGRAHFGIRQRSSRLTVAGSDALNDGEWHHIVGTHGDQGLSLYIDGVIVDARTDALVGDEYYGFWRVGGDALNGWPNQPTTDDFAGSVDEVAVYEYQVLSPQQVASHYSASDQGAVNVAPTAAFTSSSTALNVTFDGSGSSDTDGTVESYEWSFGDGATDTGVSPSHTYGSAGTYAVSLTVTDDDGATNVVVQQVTVDEANNPPTAAFTSSASALDVAFDGSGSSDTDGTIESYEWDFGDDATGTGVSPSHTYGSAGTYSVSLTVTDDDGATNVVVQQVTVAEANNGNVLATDAFGRTVANGWGSADLGGAWALTGSASNYSVDGDVGSMAYGPGQTRQATLGGVSATDVSASVDLSWDQAASGGGFFTSFKLRRQGPDSYFARLRTSDSSTTLWLARRVGGSTSYLGNVVVPLTYTPGDVWRLKFEAQGTSPTALRAKVWDLSSPEPAGWQIIEKDSSAGLQSPGDIRVQAYLSGSAAGPAVISVDNLDAHTPGDTPNGAPSAAFSWATSGLDVAFDGSGSSDGDGSIVSHSWDFGDGASDAGVSPSHTFAADGTYTVSLTVVDDDGASDSITQDVEVSAAPADAVANDAFGRVVSDGWGSADLGGAWALTGSASNYSVDGDVGSMAYGPGQTRQATLSSVSATDVSASVDLSWDQATSGGGFFTSFNLRRQGSDSYFARLRTSDSSTTLSLVRRAGGSTTFLGSVAVPLTYTPGDVWRLAFETEGTSPTTLRAKVWDVSSAEPADWQIIETDSSAELQSPGDIRVQAYLSGSAAGPAVVSVDNFVATAS